MSVATEAGLDHLGGLALWAKAIDLLDRFIREHGHPFVPPDHVTADGWRLGDFLIEARRASFARALDPSVDAALSRRGIDRSAGADTFADGLARLQRFAAREGHTVVPLTYRDADGFRLGEWRHARFEERARGSLSAKRRGVLERLEFFTAPARRGRERPVADPAPAAPDRRSSPAVRARRRAQGAALSAASFERGLAELRAFIAREGHARVNSRHETVGGYRLGQWCWWVRGRRRAGILSGEHVAQLEAVGFEWAPRDAQHERAIAEFVDARATCGPRAVYSRSGFHVRGWAETQRRRRADGHLSAERIAALDAVDFPWTAGPGEPDATFAAGLAALDRQIAAGSGPWVPSQFVLPDGFRLGAWLRDARLGLRYRRLSLEQRAALAARGVSDDHDRDRRAYGVCALGRFRDAHPGRLPTVAHREPDGFPLGVWLLVRRREARAGCLDSLLAGHLAALGVDLDAHPRPRIGAYEDRFEAALAAYRAFVAQTGRRYPRRGTLMPDGRDLSVWVMNARISWRLGRMPRERVLALESVRLTFAEPPRVTGDAAFGTALEALRAFVAAHGHDRVPRRHRLADGRPLAIWCATMRRRIRERTIFGEQRAALLAAGLMVHQGRRLRPLASMRAEPGDHLGARLRAFREQSDLSIDDIAVALGISGATIRSIEHRRPRGPTKLALVGRIADLIGLERRTAARLAGWTDEEIAAIFGDPGRAA
jgi:DNA-binding XRE family transcriptional regulator